MLTHDDTLLFVVVGKEGRMMMFLSFLPVSVTRNHWGEIVFG